MLNIVEDTPFEMLRQKAFYLKADLQEKYGVSKIVFNNSYGEGTIILFEIFSGLFAWIFDIKLSQDLKIITEYSKKNTYCFGNVFQGRQLHKFDYEKKYIEILQHQNFVLDCRSGTESSLLIPSKQDFKSCNLIIKPCLFEDSSIAEKQNLTILLKDVLISSEKKKSFRHIGKINANTTRFTKAILNNIREDLIGRIQKEASLLNLLATQIEEFEKRNIPERLRYNLTHKELSLIANIGDYIYSNLNEKISITDISYNLGISTSKLQRGVQFLYGCTVNEYITNHRLERARELIYTTDLRISEICYRVGYNSRSYFSKVFEEKFGMLPNDYKQKFASSTMLYEISYRSVAKENFSSKEISNMIDRSREMNHYHNITGSLIYYQGVFFQIIEGPQNEVLQLFDNIKNDKRHSTICQMWKGFKPKRHFEDWDLAVISDQGKLQTTVDGNLKELDLSFYIENFNESSILKDNLWRKIRSMLKQMQSS